MLDLTSFKYCPRCAENALEPFLVNGLKCRKCGFIYFHNTASAVAAIIEYDNGIILAKRAFEPAKGLYDLPGGFVDRKESLEDALRREIMEELSLEISSMSYLGSFSNLYRYEDVSYYTADAVFVCKPSPGMVPKPSEELAEITVISVDKIDLECIAFESAKRALMYYRQMNAI
jgi:ADP-ribose pyrophosphatase YjhB (NUDIX family)